MGASSARAKEPARATPIMVEIRSFAFMAILLRTFEGRAAAIVPAESAALSHCWLIDAL